MDTPDYFVLLNHPTSRPMPMLDDKDNLAFFPSKKEAKKAARTTMLGDAYGYEVFCLGCGE